MPEHQPLNSGCQSSYDLTSTRFEATPAKEIEIAKGYFIFTEDIHDQDGINAYGAKAVPTVIQSGGRPIVVADTADVIEGKWHGSRTVIIEFDSVEAAKAWYNSDEYQAVVGLRHAAAESNAVIVAGFEMPS